LRWTGLLFWFHDQGIILVVGAARVDLVTTRWLLGCGRERGSGWRLGCAVVLFDVSVFGL